MLAAYLTGALLCLAALVVGQAAMRLCGERNPSPLAPAVGLAVLFVVADLAIKLPGRATAALIAIALLLVAVVVLAATGFAPKRRWPPRASRAREEALASLEYGARGAPALLRGALVAALIAIVAASIPFLVNGRVGPLGAGLVNDDMASHLLFAEWIGTGTGPTPDQAADGYPLGPHSLVAALADLPGPDLVGGFAALTFALAALIALTAYGAFGGMRPLLRAPLAALVALAYLSAAWFAQGAFKEPTLALFLLAFALALRERQAVPLGVIAAGVLYSYSFPGLAWLAGAALVWFALEWWKDRRLPAAGAMFAIAAAITAVAAIPEIGRLIAFTGYNALNPDEVGTRPGFGNLREALGPLAGFNVWPSSEFRVSASGGSAPAVFFYAGALLGAAVLAWGMAAEWARRETALLAALVAAAGAYLAAVAFGTPYQSAKALAVLAPVAMLISLKGLFEARAAARIDGEGWFTPERDDASAALYGARFPALNRVLPVVAVLFVAGAALSSFLALRGAAVGPDDHVAQLRSLKRDIGGSRVLFLGRDQFAAWALIGSKVATPVLNYYNQKSIGNRFPPVEDKTVKLDFDAVPPEILYAYPFVITSRADYQSERLANYLPIRGTDDYVLWQQQYPNPARLTLDEPNAPGAVLDCSNPELRAISETPGSAIVFSEEPVIGAEDDWEPSERVTHSSPASQELELDEGRWSISLQYVSTQAARLRAPELDAELPANLDYRGPSAFWPAGTIEVEDEGPVRFELSVSDPPLIGKLLRSEALAFPLTIAATKVEGKPPSELFPAAGREAVLLEDACGRYVDHYFVNAVPEPSKPSESGKE